MAKEKSNIELIRVLSENIKNPFIATTAEGNIISFNKQSAKFFSFEEKAGNIFDYFNKDSAFELSALIEEVLSGRNTLIKNVTLTFINGMNLKCQATISEFNQDQVFCTFKPEEHALRISEITRMKVQKEELSALIGNEKIEKVIDSVRELFPFTVIGKEKIRKDIDRLEELFWIKNSSGTFILVNNSLARNLGLTSTQLEGRSEIELLPVYMHEVYRALENYVKDSNSVIVTEGIPIQGLSVVRNFRTIEIPLNDSDRNLAAVIGISMPVNGKEEEKGTEKKKNILAGIPAAVAVLSKEGIIEHSSKEFCKLFSDEFSDLRKLSYTNVFPLEISEKIKKFDDSLSEDAEFQVKLSKAGGWNDKELNVQVSRNYGENNQPEGLSVFIEDVSPYSDLEKIINSRGKMYEVLLQNNPEPIFIYDKENLHFIEVNQAALNLYGYRRDEFLQMDLTDLYSPEDIQTLLDASSGGIKEGIFTGPYRHKKKNGESIFIELSKTSFKFNNRDAHFNIVKDVTRNLETEKQKQLFKAAYDNSSNMIFITDSSGFIKSANGLTGRELGISNDALVNSAFVSVVNDDDRGLINSRIFQSHITGQVSVKSSLKKSNGKILETEIIANPVMNYKNEIESYVLIAKPELEPSEKTEQKVREIIIEKIVEKEGAPSEKIDPAFLSGIFHEILTPINAMLGFVQELTESLEQKTPEQQEAKEIIDQNRRRLLSTMNSVIEYSRMEQEAALLEIKEVSITEIVDETQEEISDILKNKGIEFAYGKISSSLTFKTDTQKFISLISLLFKIASQFTNTKKIYFSAYQPDDSNFIISIQDNYSAMSPAFSENFNNIFNKREIQKDYGVSRLSVKLARRLIDLLQGKFVDKSKKMSGFIFPVEPEVEEKGRETITESAEDSAVPEEMEETETTTEASVSELTDEEEIPEPEFEENTFAQEEAEEEIKFKKPREPEKKVSGKASRHNADFNNSRIDLSRLSCLYLEDQVDSQILFKVQMKDLKEIKFTVSFEEALPLLDTIHFDFIVLDINLQGEYNGLDALKIIHRMQGYETIPIIAVTAYVLPGDREKFIAAGFNDFISKPIFREKMVDSLEKIFSMMQS